MRVSKELYKMRVSKELINAYVERFNRHVDEPKRVRLAQRYGYYTIETVDGHEDVYTGMTAREAYMCVRGMLYAIGRL
jgi:hypothetical protein